MRHLKQLQLESKELEVFEVASLLRGFLEDKGIKANVEKFENFFNIYISGYANEESPKRVPVQKLLSYFKSLDICEDAAIQKTKFGYTIEMLKDGQSEKLMEAVAEEDEGHKCYICEKTYFGYGNDPWPITTEPGERVCDQCNTEYVIPARLELLLGKNKKPRREAVDKASVEHAASNVILDNKFIWLFNVLDTDGEDIEEGIEYLQDAIDSLVANNGTFLVAFPYVDPKPEDKSVELVFADNPGPVVIYNREESTVAKGKLDRPSQERKPKGESVVKEAAVTNSDLKEASDNLQLLKQILIEANNKNNFDNWKEISAAWMKVNNVISRLRLNRENLEESTITESTENYQVAVEFEQAFYLEHADDDIEISQILDAYIAQAEENLEDQGVYLDFDYCGGGAYDYISSPISYEDAKIAHKFLNDDSVTIKIMKITNESVNKGDDK